MAIDIKHTLSHKSTISPLFGHKNTDPKTAQSQQIRTAPADSVSITSQAQQVQGAQSNLSQLPEIDKAKIEAIKLAISEGHYKVDPEKLAKNIASFENELG
ncbi:flagellar biosynthesis anti-sigma factor FlgM [uncultured Shewanella sp.]|uniref:flagellar biosynthesis anti-sigma factor FlgM n=1 Tax=uncultured Shewanella sp. TaxID=173975 RepID=UPI002615FA76|nr:flagellar biosynthesis anti-sigma factor FlgM [uncultured Shewanella sp.]